MKLLKESKQTGVFAYIEANYRERREVDRDEEFRPIGGYGKELGSPDAGTHHQSRTYDCI